MILGLTSDSAAVVIALITTCGTLLATIATAVINALQHRKARDSISKLAKDVGQSNGRGPVVQMLEDLQDRSALMGAKIDQIAERQNTLDARQDVADLDLGEIRHAIVPLLADLVRSVRPGGQRHTDPQPLEHP